MRHWTFLAVLLLVAFGAGAKEWNVLEAGAVGDGLTDCTAAFQKAMDTAAAAGGGIVNVPAGHYYIKGTLKVPGAVTLQGTFRVPPADQRENRPKLDGSVLLAYAGRGNAEAEPFIRLAGSMATLAGLIVTYPEWKQSDVPPVPYPPTVYAEGVVDNGILDCCFLNSYEAIHFNLAARFIVRNVFGYPSYRGFYTDQCYDIGRVENCHFWPFAVQYQPEDPFCKWVNTQGVAFEFARTDWQYVTNTFCFGYGVGYKFSEVKNGGCNGNFLGIGADSCRRPVFVEALQPYGLLITNGEFVGRWGGQDSAGVEIAEGAGAGKVSLVNCAFWGPLDRCIWSRSPKVQLTATACNFCSWDNGVKGSPAVQIDAGKTILQGNTFADGDTHIKVAAEVVSAIITGNQAESGLVVDNEAGARSQIALNEVSPIEWTKKALAHYSISVGSRGDRLYLRGWHGQEKAGEWPDGGTKRWSGADSVLKLPVIPRKSYTITLDVHVPGYALDPGNGLYLGDKKLADLKVEGTTGLVTAKMPPSRESCVTLTLRVKTWSPKDVIPGNTDGRALGIAVRSVEMKAKGGSKNVFNANTGKWISSE